MIWVLFVVALLDGGYEYTVNYYDTVEDCRTSGAVVVQAYMQEHVPSRVYAHCLETWGT